MKYTKQYFIDKFTAIDNSDWGVGKLENHCVLHHCGCHMKYDFAMQLNGTYVITDEAVALGDLLMTSSIVKTSEFYSPDANSIAWTINDGITVIADGYYPKDRILNALNAIPE